MGKRPHECTVGAAQYGAKRLCPVFCVTLFYVSNLTEACFQPRECTVGAKRLGPVFCDTLLDGSNLTESSNLTEASWNNWPTRPTGQLASQPTGQLAKWPTGQPATWPLANWPPGQPANWPDGQLANQASYFRPDPAAFSLHFAPLRLPTPGNFKIPPTDKVGG